MYIYIFKSKYVFGRTHLPAIRLGSWRKSIQFLKYFFILCLSFKYLTVGKWEQLSFCEFFLKLEQYILEKVHFAEFMFDVYYQRILIGEAWGNWADGILPQKGRKTRERDSKADWRPTAYLIISPSIQKVSWQRFHDVFIPILVRQNIIIHQGPS